MERGCVGRAIRARAISSREATQACLDRIAHGLPVGVQIMGQRFREDTVLDAGEIIEARAGVLTPIDPR